MIDRLKKLDWDKWLRNTAIFGAPFLLVFLVAIQGGADVRAALSVLYLYALNVIIDLIKKFIAANPEP